MHTRWKRCYPTIVGKRFFDGGDYGMGFFTVIKAYKCKEYCKGALAPDMTNWFPEEMIVIKTDTGLRYKIPFCPWWRIIEADTNKKWEDFYNENPW